MNLDGLNRHTQVARDVRWLYRECEVRATSWKETFAHNLKRHGAGEGNRTPV